MLTRSCTFFWVCCAIERGSGRTRVSPHHALGLSVESFWRSPDPPVHFFEQYALLCVILFDMAVYKNKTFSRRLPDLITKELVLVLSQKGSYEFKKLFEIVHENLRRKNAANGGEEMLRLRSYEKLQNLVSSGAVKKNGKIYTGNSTALAVMDANATQAAMTR